MTKSIDDRILEIEDYIGGNVEGVENIDRMSLTVFLRRQLTQAQNEARIDELEKIMDMPGNAFVGNGENEIHWSTRNRLAQLRKDSE